MSVRLALPKGRLQAQTAEFLQTVGIELTDYSDNSRSYRLASSQFPDFFVKVFQEKDVVVQTAIGNYDIGICGSEWVEELLGRYPGKPIVTMGNLGYGTRHLFAATSRKGEYGSVDALRDLTNNGGVRIASEYPNLAELFALRQRMRRFRIFPVWGAAEAYPPENAEMAIIAAESEAALEANGLVSLGRVMSGNAQIIVNRESMNRIDLSRFLNFLSQTSLGAEFASSSSNRESNGTETEQGEPWKVTGEAGTLRFALPDGHQQSPTIDLLRRADLLFEGYTDGSLSRRPVAAMEGVVAKVIRPQDMPLQVANGNFDLAITGLDWLTDHKSQFPASPVTELVDLEFGRVRIVAAVSGDLPANDPNEMRHWMAKRDKTHLRVASEYVNLVDKYASDHHLAPYRVIPTWGATEAFIPEDADLLVENTETGTTLARNNLKVIDTLFISSARLIGRMDPQESDILKRRKEAIIEILRRAADTSS